MRLCGWVCEKLSVCMFRSGYAWVCFMQGGAGAEPDPCVFYLHLNEARGDLPFCCSHFSVCLSLPVSPADIDLFAKQGDRQCFQLFQTLCFPFHLYLGKALTPHVAAMCVAFCTWTSPAQSPVCMCVSVRVCLSWKVDVHVDAMCLRVSDPVPNQLCLLSWTGACSSLQIHPDVQQFI